MEEVLALIEKIIEEHERIIHGLGNLVQAADDASAILALGGAKEDFMPGRLDQKQGLQKLEEVLEAIDIGVQGHFGREETALLAAFEKHGGEMLVSALRKLLAEHAELRGRLAHAKKHVAELMGGDLSHHVWEASAHDMRAHISHTEKLFEAHAEGEQQLLHELKRRLQGEAKG